MKLISWNIAIMMDNSQDVADFINEKKVDFVCLQESIRHLDDAVYPKFQSSRLIRRKLKHMQYSFFGPQWVANADIKEGKICKDYGGFIEQGNEVLSKYPIISAVNEHYYGNYDLSVDRTNFYTDDHARSVAIVEINIESELLQILNLHGNWSRECLDSQRALKQCEYIVAAAKRKNVATIIVGDFNLLPETKGIKILEKEFTNLIKKYRVKATRPKYKGCKKVMDYIFVNDKIKINNFEVVESEISDHFPLMLDFEIKY